MDDTPLPRTVEVLWRRHGTARSRPPQALSVDRIVATAIEIADAEGLGALSMARLAERLGCATMSLYRHVANKDELYAFMMDTAPGEPPALDDTVGWRAGIERWARALLAVYLDHPWILNVPLTGPPLEPGQLVWLETALRTLGGTALPPADKMSVVLMTLSYVRGEAGLQIALARANREAGLDAEEADLRYARTVAGLIDAKRFPAMTEVFGGTAAERGEDEGFDFGLARLLDGVDAFVRTRAGAVTRG
jgi:AcrR family transcriptional regulator